MFLPSKYVLGNELVVCMYINIANISIMRKKFEHNDDYYTVRKLNGCSFINKKAINLPVYIKKGIEEHDFTDMSDKLPVPYVKSEFNVTEKQWLDSGLVMYKQTVAGKKFYVFDDDFVKIVKNKNTYVLTEFENIICKEEKSIIDSIRISNDRFIAWY